MKPGMLFMNWIKRNYNHSKIIRMALGGVSVIIILAIVMIVQSGTGAPSIATHIAQKGEFIIDISEKGELKAAQSAIVGVPQNVWGDLRVTVLVEDGAMVKEGDFLVQFDPSEFQNRLNDSQNRLENAQADLASITARIESDRKQQENQLKIQEYSYEQSKLKYQQMKYESLSRQREMELEFKKAELSLQQAREKLESQKVIDEANMKKSELSVKQAEMNLQRTQEQVNSLTLTAPKSGMVVLQKVWSSGGSMSKVKVGDSVWRGFDLVHIPDLSVMQVKTQINEVDIARLSAGQRAIITLDALEGPTFYGKVTSVAKLARSEQGSDEKIFDVEVTVDGSDERLKPGMTAECRIVTDTINDVLFVPLEAVFEKEDTTVVYVKNRTYDLRSVRLGAKNSNYVIIEDGLKQGDEVALRDPTLPLEDLGIGSKEAVKKSGGNGKSL